MPNPTSLLLLGVFTVVGLFLGTAFGILNTQGAIGVQHVALVMGVTIGFLLNLRRTKTPKSN